MKFYLHGTFITLTGERVLTPTVIQYHHLMCLQVTQLAQEIFLSHASLRGEI